MTSSFAAHVDNGEEAIVYWDDQGFAGLRYFLGNHRAARRLSRGHDLIEETGDVLVSEDPQSALRSLSRERSLGGYVLRSAARR